MTMQLTEHPHIATDDRILSGEPTYAAAQGLAILTHNRGDFQRRADTYFTQGLCGDHHCDPPVPPGAGESLDHRVEPIHR